MNELTNINLKGHRILFMEEEKKGAVIGSTESSFVKGKVCFTGPEANVKVGDIAYFDRSLVQDFEELEEPLLLADNDSLIGNL